jgi:hypothetical protein
MTLAVTDIDRPDVNGVQPKMYGIKSLAVSELYINLSVHKIPFIKIECDDNIMSSVDIIGSFDDRSLWANGIWENSHYFRFSIEPANGKRYYEAGQPVTVELARKSYKIATKFRKFTGTPEKAIEKIRA